MKKKVIDGKEVMVMDDNPDNYFSINQLRNFMDVRLDKFDYVGAIDREVNALGEFQINDISKIAGINKMVSIKEVLDPTNRTRLSDEEKKTITTYQEWEKNMISAQLSNPYNQLSILTNGIDRVPETQDYYEPTFDSNLAKTNKKYIFLKDEGSGQFVPDFTEEQTKNATEFLRSQTRNALDRESKVQVTAQPQGRPPTQYEYERGDKGRKSVEVANMLGQLYYGNDNEVDAGLEYFRDSIPNAEKLVRNDSGVTVLFNDGTSRDISFINEDGSIKSLEMFIKGAGPLFTGNLDVNTALSRGGFVRGKEFSTLGAERVREVKGQTASNAPLPQQATSYLRSTLTPDLFNQTESKAVPEIAAIIAPLGFTARESGIGDYFTITAPDGTTEEQFSIDEGEQESQSVMEQILAFMQGQYDVQKLANAKQIGIFEAGSTSKGGELD
jgi:hypothetical protein